MYTVWVNLDLGHFSRFGRLLSASVSNLEPMWSQTAAQVEAVAQLGFMGCLPDVRTLVRCPLSPLLLAIFGVAQTVSND